MPQPIFLHQKQTFSQAQKEFDTLLHQPKADRGIKLVFILLGLSWLVLVWFWPQLPPKVPLLYSRPWGEDQLVTKPLIFLLPGTATLLTLINLRLASFFFKTDRFLSHLLVWLNLIVVILAVTTLIRILLIIT